MVDASFISNSAMRPSAVLADGSTCSLFRLESVHPPLPSHRRRFFLPPSSLPLFSPLVSHMSALGAVNISPAGSPATAVAANAVVQPAWWCCVWLRQPGRKSNKFALHSHANLAGKLPKRRRVCLFLCHPARPSPCPPTAPGFDFRPYPSSIRLGVLGPKLFFVTGLVIFATAVARLVCPDLLG